MRIFKKMMNKLKTRKTNNDNHNAQQEKNIVGSQRDNNTLAIHELNNERANAYTNHLTTTIIHQITFVLSPNTAKYNNNILMYYNQLSYRRRVAGAQAQTTPTVVIGKFLNTSIIRIKGIFKVSMDGSKSSMDRISAPYNTVQQ